MHIYRCFEVDNNKFTILELMQQITSFPFPKNISYNISYYNNMSTKELDHIITFLCLILCRSDCSKY